MLVTPIIHKEGRILIVKRNKKLWERLYMSMFTPETRSRRNTKHR